MTLAPRYEISTSLGSNARLISAATEDAGRRAKESQDIARKAEQEAKDVAETVLNKGAKELLSYCDFHNINLVIISAKTKVNFDLSMSFWEY